MNYRHIYHVGNFADVFKHYILTTLIKALQKKEQPIAILDTHAAIGKYDLLEIEAQKTGEYLSGIAKIWPKKGLPQGLPNSFDTYFSCLSALNLDGELRYYPGSPLISHNLLNSHDRLILSELHKDDYLTLKHLFRRESKVAIHHLNGYLAMKAFLPFPEKRGLVFIDPAYEQKDELSMIYKAMEIAYKRMRNAIYAIWYPIKDGMACEDFLPTNIKNVLQIEMLIGHDPNSANKLHGGFNLKGCGILIVNPPFQLEETLKEGLEALLPFIKMPAGQCGVKFRYIS